MRDATLKVYVRVNAFWSALLEENGQDLVEYGLVLVLVCLAATAGMSTLANGINQAMTNISNKLSTYST